jgi:hypothetical protein
MRDKYISVKLFLTGLTFYGLTVIICASLLSCHLPLPSRPNKVPNSHPAHPTIYPNVLDTMPNLQPRYVNEDKERDNAMDYLKTLVAMEVEEHCVKLIANK